MQVLLEMNAHDVMVVYNESVGVIRNITTSTSIEALVQRTSAFVQIQNTGTLRSEFDVAVTACDPDTILRPLAGSKLALDPEEISTVEIKLEDSTLNATTYNCTSTLSDSEGVVLSAMSFGFNISSAAIDRGVQGSDGSKGDALGNVTESSAVIQPDPCSSECSGFFSVLCFAANACWSKMGTFLGTLTGVSLGMFLLNKFGVVSMVWSGLKAMLCSGTPKRRNSDVALPYEPAHQYYRYPPNYPFQNYPLNPYAMQR